MGSVFGGFALAGGHVASLFQPLELLMIGGAAVGAFVVGNPLKVLKSTAASLPKLLKSSPYTKSLFMELLGLLFVGLLETNAADGTKVLQCIKVTLLASLQGYAPVLAIEFGRKVLYSTERPSFSELEKHVKRKDK